MIRLAPLRTARARRWARKNPKAVRVAKAKWRGRRLHQLRAASRRWREKNPGANASACRRWRARQRDKQA